MKRTTLWLKALMPPVLIVAAALLALGLFALKPEQEKKEPVPILPTIEVFTVETVDRPLRIESQGTVVPRRQTRLTARVSGHIEWVSPDFYTGGTFKEGTVLIELDPLPYRSALAEARSRLALAEATLLQEQQAAEQALEDWARIGGVGEPSPLVLRQPQLIKARADKEAAEVGVQLAEDNLSYTEIRAPYNGRVDRKFVDVGQAITAQATVLADIHASDTMEIPVALSLDELSFLEPAEKPTARLSAEIGGEKHHWEGYLDRTAASVDERSRMITAIVRKDAPFASDRGHPLTPGMFVRVQIEGRQLGRLYRFPRRLLRPGDVVYRLTSDSRLESVKLDVLYTDSETAVVRGGVQAGDRLCVTPLLFFVEGMHVAVAGESASTDGAPENETPDDPRP